MSIYISLIKWTDQGIRNVKESPQRLDAAKKAIEAAGGKMTGFYLTMGRYDAVFIDDFPAMKRRRLTSWARPDWATTVRRP